MTFTSQGYRAVEVLAIEQDVEATVRLMARPVGSAAPWEEAFAANANVPVLRLSLSPDTQYKLLGRGCTVGYAYLCGGAQEEAVGIQLLYTYGQPVASPAALARAIAQNPYREQVHFTPPTGWLNDPNGLCHHGGMYHLYYQFYPHAQQWGNMHWGHATSKDLLHWVHRPVFLVPQQILQEDTTLAGGAFSGSAVHDGDGLRFFLTRHLAPKACEASMVETQTMVQSPDGFAKGEEITVLAKGEPFHSYHFRDPKVLTHEGKQYMVLGTCVEGVPAVALYVSEQWTQWTFKGSVIRADAAAQAQGCESLECPDLFPLDDTWVCLGAHMNRTDLQNRKNPVCYAIGAWSGGAMDVQQEGLLDFGGSFYAVQTFAHAGRRIALGWVGDFYAEHTVTPEGVCGSITLPRELTLRKGRLFQAPAAEVYSLLGAVLYQGNWPARVGTNGQENCLCVPVEGNCYYAKITLPDSAPFHCTLAQDGAHSLCLVGDGVTTTLLSSRLVGRRFAAQCGAVTTVEVFFDRRTAEVFLNGGEAVGTKTFYCKSLQGQFVFSAQGVAEIVVRSL